MVETTVDVVGCEVCGVRAKSHDRTRVAVRDLACFGRPARLVWVKRRWRCVEVGCAARTWTEWSSTARRSSMTPTASDPVEQLGVDETSFLKANREHATVYATGLVDLASGS